MRSITQFKGLWACGNAEGDMEMSKFRIFLSASDLEDILIGLHIKLSQVTVLGCDFKLDGFLSFDTQDRFWVIVFLLFFLA
jgi:hypothetical protein